MVRKSVARAHETTLMVGVQSTLIQPLYDEEQLRGTRGRVLRSRVEALPNV